MTLLDRLVKNVTFEVFGKCDYRIVQKMILMWLLCNVIIGLDPIICEQGMTVLLSATREFALKTSQSVFFVSINQCSEMTKNA